ncbi:UNVERIFIED_CONTAM: hypothetical protein GTU68_029940 [Idotea baltica]|nr:hypothetical protein [Idotea baltica]
MRRALELAARGEGLVEPNPMVGCVVVRDGKIVGEGWHERFGGPHAEVNALTAAGEAARGATLFVTLEPCCHTGKTPPCVEAVLAAGVARVVLAMRDPFPQVDGGGVRALEAAGVACTVGVLEEEAGGLVAPYLKLVTTGRPWVIAKWPLFSNAAIDERPRRIAPNLCPRAKRARNSNASTVEYLASATRGICPSTANGRVRVDPPAAAIPSTSHSHKSGLQACEKRPPRTTLARATRRGRYTLQACRHSVLRQKELKDVTSTIEESQEKRVTTHFRRAQSS